MIIDKGLSLLRSASVAALTAGMLLGAAGSASAAEAAADSASQAAGTLAEVVVTGERREEKLQKVPASVAAITSQRLQDAGVQNFYDLQSQTPSLNIVETGTNSRFINIRGVGVSVSTPFQYAGVPLHVDGMYVPNSAGFIRDAYFDVDQVEVYRGPQGTFAGQNSTGGAVFVNTKQPSFDGVDAQVQQLIGNYNWFQTQGFINVPLSDTFAARIAFNQETRNSFFKNDGGGNPYGANPSDRGGSTPGNVSVKTMRAILRWRPDEKLDVRLRFDYQDQADDAPATQRGAPNSYNDPDALIDPWTLHWDTPSYYKSNLYRGILNVAYQINDDLLLKSVTGGQYQSVRFFQDGDSYTPFLPDPYAPSTYVTAQSVNDFRNLYNYWFQEVDLVSTGSGPLKWTLGGVVFNELDWIYNRTPTYNRGNCATIAQPACTTSAIYNGGSNLDYHQKFRSYSGFGEATYSFSDSLRLTAGLRYTDYTVTLLPDSSVRSSVTGALLTSCGGPCNVYGEGHYGRFTGRVALNWFPTADTNLYATFSQGMKPGGFYSQYTLGISHAAQVATDQTQYRSETVRNYEVGAKTMLFDRHLRANVSGFYEDYRDYQANFVIPGTIIPRAFNIPKSRILGSEVELEGVFGDFHVTATGAYVNSKILSDSTVNVTANYFAPGCPSGTSLSAACQARLPTTLTYGGIGPTGPFWTFDPKGEPLNYSPKWTLNGALEYDFHVGASTITPRIQYAYVADQWVSLFHASQDSMPSHHTIDLRLTYKAPEHLRVEGFVTNVTNELYIGGVVPGANAANASAGLVNLGAPRQYGMRVQYSY